MKQSRFKSVLFAVALAACSDASTQPEVQAPARAEAAESRTSGEQAAPEPAGADAAVAALADVWHCKAQDNIPIGVLTISASGKYDFVVVRNSLWEPKPADPGNGGGMMGAADGLVKPLDGPLVDQYEILGVANYSDDAGTKIYLNNDFGTLLVCTPASSEG